VWNVFLKEAVDLSEDRIRNEWVQCMEVNEGGKFIDVV
jgi:hypothetical protein